MKFEKICDVLKYLESEGIEYVVLRGYIPVEDVNKSLDVDIYIPRKYKSKVKKLFNKLGWYSQKINCSRYPHKQYIYLFDNCVKKIDIVYGLFYGNELRELTYEDRILEGVRKDSGINIPNPTIALHTFLLHVIYDKKMLSDKNRKILELMYNDYKQNETERNESVFLDIAEELLNDKSSDGKSIIAKYSEIIKSKGILKYNFLRHKYFKIINTINNIVRYSLIRLANKSICILGVDGSGKSTTTESLKTLLGNMATIKYMGFKDYETTYIKKHFENKKGTFFYKVKSIIYPWIEMWKRYFSVRFKKELIIYDRFPWEAAVNNTGIMKCIYYLQYNLFFPKPKRVYYLYCSEETSLKRKNDIADEEVFKLMKKRFDKKYLHKKNIKCISTDDYSTDEITDIIIKDINNNMLKYLI